MLLVFYLALDLFILHSALLMASETLMILAIFMMLLPVCFFLLLFVQRFLVSVRFSVQDDCLSVVVKKKGILPAGGIRMTVSFTYDQSGLRDEKKTTFTVPSGLSSISIEMKLDYAGSGTFSLDSCRLTDYIGFFSLPVRKRKQVRTEIDLLPELLSVDFYAEGNELTGTMSDHSVTVDKVGDDPSETLQIRSYHPGDRISRIHWKLSAKIDETMIRDFASESDSRYLFVLSFGERSQEKYHEVVRNYFAIASSLLSQEISHRVCWVDQNDTLWQESISGENDLQNVCMLIARSFRLADLYDRENAEKKEKFSLYSADIVLEEMNERMNRSAFIKQFTITGEPLEVLQERWTEDEE